MQVLLISFQFLPPMYVFGKVLLQPTEPQSFSNRIRRLQNATLTCCKIEVKAFSGFVLLPMQTPRGILHPLPTCDWLATGGQ